MYNKNKVRELFGLVGFRQLTDPKFTYSIASDLLVSRSGLFVEDENSLLKSENLFLIKPEDKDFNDFLREAVYTSINKLLSRVFTYKKLTKVTKSIFENRNMFRGAGRIDQLQEKKGRFVGFEITPHYYKNIVVKLNRIGVQFSQNQALTFYLYKSGTKEPVSTYQITNPNPINFFWQTPTEEILLEFDNHENHPGGSYFFGYYEDDLQGQAVKRELDYQRQNRNCLQCRSYEHESFQLYGKYFTVRPIEVNPSFLDGVNLFDIDAVSDSGTTNHGLNLAFTVFCDLSRFIVENEYLLQDALIKQVALDLLEKAANNLEVSGLAERMKQHAMVALDDDRNGNKGYRSEYKYFMKGLEIDYSGLDSPCLPKSVKRGVTFGSF